MAFSCLQKERTEPLLLLISYQVSDEEGWTDLERKDPCCPRHRLADLFVNLASEVPGLAPTCNKDRNIPRCQEGRRSADVWSLATAKNFRFLKTATSSLFQTKTL